MQSGQISDLTVVVQAGGESKRMGAPKAFVPFLGEPLIMRSVRRLYPMCSEMLVTTNSVEHMDFLNEYMMWGHLRIVRDLCKQRGALVGMRTALREAKTDYVAMVACDMVFPSAGLLKFLYEKLKEGSYDVAVPKTRFGYEPFHAVYRRKTCLPVVEQALSEHQVKATSWFGEVNVYEADSKSIAKINPQGGAFVNVNTPTELRAIENRILLGEISDSSGDDFGETF